MCTRVVYSGSNGMVATGRSMDWKTDMHSNLWVFPRGMKRNGETGENSLEWIMRSNQLSYPAIISQLRVQR